MKHRKHETSGPGGRTGNLRPADFLLILVIGFHLAPVPRSSAQSYSISWFKVAGGGGTSTGGVYSVNGTIGQPDAGGVMAGGQYSVTGGFWSLFAVQTHGAPTLRIFLTQTNTAIVAWPASSTGYSLQSNPILGTTNWSAVTNNVNIAGAENQVTISPPSGARYFRLWHP